MPDPLKAERLLMLQTLLNEQQAAFNQAHVGRIMPVLFDRVGRKAGQLVGRSPFMQSVHVPAADASKARLIGSVLPVQINAAHPNSLAGEILIAEQEIWQASPRLQRPFRGESGVKA